MAKEGDMSLFNDVLEPFRRAINTNSPKDKLSAATNLNFSDSNQSIKEGVSNLILLGKRKFSLGSNDVTPQKRPHQDSSIRTTPGVAPPPSPWEIRKMKADLLAAKAQIIKLESRVNQQHKIRKEMQLLFEEEKSSLVDQHKKDESAIAQMEERVKAVKKRESELKEDFNTAMKEHKEEKTKWDNEKAILHKQIGELKDKLLEANSTSRGQLSEMKKDMNELLQALEGAQSEVEMLKAELEEQTARAEQCTSLANQLEKQTLELQTLNNKYKDLEYERDSYKDWQQQVKTAQKRLSNMADLEKEVIRLRATERSLREAIGDKLLLEEQVHQLNGRVEAMKKQVQELHECKVRLSSAERELEEWRAVGTSHGASNPRALGSALDSALNSQLTAVATCGNTQSQLAQLSEEVATLKFERDKATRTLSEVETVRKNQQSLIHRLQKRLLLVTRERDSYRQQLDCYEKELTVTVSGESGAGSEALLAARVQQLERSLQTYRDQLAAYDQDNHLQMVETARSEAARARDEAAAAKREAAALRVQRDRLHAQLERLGDYADTKVLHLTDNPAAAAEKQMQTELASAQEEIKRLRASLGSGGAAVSADTQALQQQLDNSRIKLQRMKEEFTSSAQEYRDVCYMLLGYKIDRTGHKNYRISNMYAESADEYLMFKLCDDGIEMVHTEYSSTLTDLVELHLLHHRSIPVFLSALTMDLFTRTTIQHQTESAD